jgi:hypothetical protein
MFEMSSTLHFFFQGVHIAEFAFLCFKGTVSPVYNYLKVIAFKSPWYEHMAPDIKSFFNCLFNLQ